MTKANPIISNFTAGEFSPRLYGRTDLAKYYNSCKTMENFIVLPHGGATRRPGTYFAYESMGRDHVTYGDFSASTDWTLGTGWSVADGKAVGAAGSASALSQDPEDITEGEVYEIVFTISDRTAGTITPSIGGEDGTAVTEDDTYTERITCGATTVIALTKSADFDGKVDNVSVRQVAPTTRLIEFEFSTVQTYILAFTDQNVRVFKDSGIVLDGTTPHEISTPWAAADLFELKYTQSADREYIWHPEYPEYQLTRTAHTSWTLTKTDYANGPWEESKTTTGITPSDTSGAITLTSTLAIFEEEDIGRYIRLYCTGSVWRYALITAYTSTKVVTATVKGSALPDANAITTYQEGTFCDDLGYPSCGDFFEERLVRAGSTEYPQTQWFSASGDYDNMETGTDDDDAFTVTIAAKGVNAIQWLVPQSVILLGTVGAEWKVGVNDTVEPISVSNITTRRQSTYGSANIQGLLVNDACLYVQRGSRKIREMAYSWEKDSFVAPDLTMLAEHITRGGITSIAYQQEPDSTLWCIRDDGYLLGMTYMRDQDVIGWHKHNTKAGADEFESVAVITSSGEDQVWTVVKRTIGTEVRRYIEYFMPRDFTADLSTDADKVKNAFFVDSGLSTDNGDAMTITGVTAADPVVITVAAATASDEDFITITGVVGMTELNGNTYKLASNAGLTYELTDADDVDIDGSEFTEYDSGGSALPVAKTYSGLDHLIGETVSVLADGNVHADVEVDSDGEITLEDYYNVVHAGLNITSTLQPMAIEAGAVAGTSQGKKKRIHRLVVRFYETSGCKAGRDVDHVEEYVFSGSSDMDTPMPLYTGDKPLDGFPGDWESDADMVFVCDTPLPCTILAIMPELTTNDML